MKLDLDALHARHVRLHPDHAADLALHAAVALQRETHAVGVSLDAHVFRVAAGPTLHWRPRSNDAGEMLDANRVTELGAEAVALALVHETQGWIARRRLQRGDSADWLLEDESGKLVALEVSGTVVGDAQARLAEKLLQGNRSGPA